MILTPDLYGTVPVYDLLLEAEKGRLGFDHRLLDALDARREETLAALKRFSEGFHDDPVVDLKEQVFDLYRHYRTPEAVEFYGRMLRRNSGDLPDELVQAFVELGCAAVEPLLKLRAELGPEEGADIPFVMAAIRCRDERVLRLLIETLHTDVYEGALCLGLYSDPAAADELKAARARASQEEIHSIDAALQQLHAEPPPPLDWTFDIRSLYPDRIGPLFGALDEKDTIEFLNCKDEEYRADAALSFADEGYSDLVRDELLEHARKDPSAVVRAACLRALGERAEEPDVDALLRSVLDEAGKPAVERCAALVGCRPPAAILAYYANPDTRAAALEAMWRTLDAHYADYFPRHAEDPDLEVRRRAFQGIGAFNLSKHAHLLIPSFSVDEVREEALLAYALSMPGKTTPKSVHKMLETIDEHAGGLNSVEVEVVEFGLDRRLEREGLEPVFHPDHEHDDEEFEDEIAPFIPEPAQSNKVGRNEPCPCGSGKKYKKCCGA